MTVSVARYSEEERLDITVDGQLDISVARQLFDACDAISDNLVTCVIDCSNVDSVLDSGRALLKLLVCELKMCNVTTIIIGDSDQLGCEARPAMNFQMVC